MVRLNSKFTRNSGGCNNKIKQKKPVHSPKSVSPYFNISQKLENIANGFWPLANLYFHLIYKKKLEREMAMARLNPGASVLHIGCGPCPYTAIFLAENGLKVKAVDYNEEAVYKAKCLVKKKNLEDYVSITCKNGNTSNDTQYDAVWVSLNVSPKEKVLEKSFLSLNEGGVLIYRNVPRWLSSYFISVLPEKWSAANQTETCTSLFGSESVMVKKNALTETKASPR